MTAERQKFLVNELKEGMFVADLDRPWHETPFPLQGFYIRDNNDVNALREYCSHVYVDIKRAKAPKVYEAHAVADPVSAPRKAKPTIKHATGDKKTKREDALVLPPIKIKSPVSYQVSTPIKSEVAKVTKLHASVYRAISNVFANLEAGGSVSIEETESVAAGMVASVVRNPDALVWLAKMNEADDYSYKHSVNGSIWALVIGRHLGLDEVTLRNLATGVLLSHVGKTKLPEHCLKDESDLSEEEFDIYSNYVDLGVKALRESECANEAVIAVIKHHRERHNGSGFPQGITGDRIPIIAKIAGLVDYYQALVSPRKKRKALSPVEAVSELYAQRNITFQEDIVEKFIEAVGVYPTGTIVELSNEEVGIVLGHNAERRLLPKVMVVMDENKQPLKSGKIIDLKQYNEEQGKSRPLQIRDSLPAGAHNIDASEYLITGAKSKWSWKHFKGTLLSGS